MGSGKQSFFRKLFGMMVNPAGVLKKVLSDSGWYWSVLVSGLAFMMFFAQTGLDVYKTGQQGLMYVVKMTAIGLAYGAIVIPVIAIIIWIILKISKTEISVLQSISVICMSYSGALIYGICGILFSLAMGWNTSIAFGVTGVLWALGPMMYTIRSVTGGKRGLSIPISTIVGIFVLYSWYIIGKG